jgi:hypothetical protein
MGAARRAALLDLPNELLVHLLRFIGLGDVAGVARAWRGLRAQRAEWVWHVLAREQAAQGKRHEARLGRVMGSDCCAASERLPGAWRALAGAGLASGVLGGGVGARARGAGAGAAPQPPGGARG